MAVDYLPRPDNEFQPWQNNFVTYTQAHLSELGLTEADLTALTTPQTQWNKSYNTHLTAQATALSARQQKDDDRSSYEQTLRTLVRQLQSNPRLTNAQRAALGITIPNDNRTPTGAPTSRPTVTIKNLEAHRHTINFIDENTPTRRAKPEGIMGAEIWVQIGDTAPKSSDDLTFLGLDTQTPYIAEFDPSHTGKTAYYQLRWINRKGEQGPWSTLVSAMITR